MQEQVLPCVAETDLSIRECIFINTLIPTARGAEGTRPYCETTTKEEHICRSQTCFVDTKSFWISTESRRFPKYHLSWLALFEMFGVFVLIANTVVGLNGLSWIMCSDAAL